MKTITTIILAAFCCLLSDAVIAQSLLVDGAEWRFTTKNSNFSSSYSINKYRIEGDTIIQQKACKIMTKTFETCDFRPKIEYLYEQNDSLFFYYEQEEKFSLLYSSSWEAGDTIVLEPWLDDLWDNQEECPYDSVYYIKIDSIGEIQFGPLTLKKFYVRYDIYDYEGDGINFPTDIYANKVIVEHIGSLDNFFHFYETSYCDGRVNVNLRCFSHPEYGTFNFLLEDGIIDFLGGDCDSLPPTGTQEIKNMTSPISIYPNPVKDQLNIYSKEVMRNLTLSIYHLNGHRIVEEKIALMQNGPYVFPIPTLPESAFIVNIKNANGESVYFQKILQVQ
jgi:Secretion system C-terminal sorting domain